MASLKDRLTQGFADLRERRPVVDHAVRAVQHFGKVNGTAQAGAVTFFGFLSVFPILALGFVVIGWVSAAAPALRDDLVTEVGNLFPGVIGDGPNEISLETFQNAANTVGIFALAGLLYSGLGWLSGMRFALRVMFAKGQDEKFNFVVGKLRDLLVLTLVGVVLVLSVALSGLVSGFSERIITFVGLDPDAFLPELVLRGIAYALAIGASTLLLVLMFRLLAAPHAPRISLVKGALLGAVGFEVLKAVAGLLIAQTKGQPAFQAFGVALVLVVWINYFSRLVMLAAAWAYTSPGAIEQRRREAMRAPGVALAENGSRAPVRAPAAVARGVGSEVDDGSGEDARDASRRRGKRLAVAGLALLAAAGAAVVGRRNP